MYVTKKDFETSFTGWSFIVGSLLLWLGWMIMPHHIGEYIEDERQGKGTFSYPDGSKYTGDFLAGKMHGQGTYTFSNDAQYIGGYREDKQHGQGTLIYSNGSKYVGLFKDGVIVDPSVNEDMSQNQ